MIIANMSGSIHGMRTRLVSPERLSMSGCCRRMHSLRHISTVPSESPGKIISEELCRSSKYFNRAARLVGGRARRRSNMEGHLKCNTAEETHSEDSMNLEA